jgi:hypothetical protein
MSVWYQAGPFIMHATDQDWLRLAAEHNGDIESAIRQAPFADMGYSDRWKDCYERMLEKEENEEVPMDIRISGFMEVGRDHQLQLTCNHPTSLVFRQWATRILDFIKIPFIQHTFPSVADCLVNPNMAGLPCEESATTGARDILSLKWGGRLEDNESGRQVARTRLTQLCAA